MEKLANDPERKALVLFFFLTLQYINQAIKLKNWIVLNEFKVKK